MTAFLPERRRFTRITDRAAFRMLVSAQARANEILRSANDDAERLRADARVYAKELTREAAELLDQVATIHAEAQFLHPNEERPDQIAGAHLIDLDEQFDRYIDLDLGSDPAKDWMLGSKS
jgi:cell division septum initiation protein DivIVA